MSWWPKHRLITQRCGIGPRLAKARPHPELSGGAQEEMVLSVRDRTIT